MKTSTVILLLAALALLFGLGLACLSVVFDPFSLPFQDYDQMPPAAQQAYEARSAFMQILRLAGCGISLLALISLPVFWLVSRKKQNGIVS